LSRRKVERSLRDSAKSDAAGSGRKRYAGHLRLAHMLLSVLIQPFRSRHSSRRGRRPPPTPSHPASSPSCFPPWRRQRTRMSSQAICRLATASGHSNPTGAPSPIHRPATTPGISGSSLSRVKTVVSASSTTWNPTSSLAGASVPSFCSRNSKSQRAGTPSSSTNPMPATTCSSRCAPKCGWS